MEAGAAVLGAEAAADAVVGVGVTWTLLEAAACSACCGAFAEVTGVGVDELAAGAAAGATLVGAWLRAVARAVSDSRSEPPPYAVMTRCTSSIGST